MSIIPYPSTMNPYGQTVGSFVGGVQPSYGMGGPIQMRERTITMMGGSPMGGAMQPMMGSYGSYAPPMVSTPMVSAVQPYGGFQGPIMQHGGYGGYPMMQQQHQQMQPLQPQQSWPTDDAKSFDKDILDDKKDIQKARMLQVKLEKARAEASLAGVVAREKALITDQAIIDVEDHQYKFKERLEKRYKSLLPKD